jgi:hypothetical protein
VASLPDLGAVTWIAPILRIDTQHGRRVVDYRICPTCGVSFGRNASKRSKGQRYCSRTCLGPVFSTKEARTCRQCGKSFTASRYAIQRGWGQCCSRACRGRHHSDSVAPYRVGQWVSCRQCRQRFYHYPRTDQKHYGYFCSRACSVRYSVGKGRKSPGSRSGYGGVYPSNRPTRPWNVQIRHLGKVHSFGTYADPEEAARAYDRAARQLHGKHAILNFPDEEDVQR